MKQWIIVHRTAATGEPKYLGYSSHGGITHWYMGQKFAKRFDSYDDMLKAAALYTGVPLSIRVLTVRK